MTAVCVHDLCINAQETPSTHNVGSNANFRTQQSTALAVSMNSMVCLQALVLCTARLLETWPQ